MTVSIIIPTYRDWNRLILCLKALTVQSYSKSEFEIIVVNNDPKDEIPVSFQLPDNCILINEPAPGSYAARNAALRIAKGQILGFTDSDCIPDKDWIANAVAIFSEKTAIDRIGGKIQIFSNYRTPRWVELYDFVFAFPQEQNCKEGFAVTGNMFSRRKIFNEIGFFDESLKSGGDAQWGILANTLGYKILYCEDVAVQHPARSSHRELVTKAKRVGIGMSKFEGAKNVSKIKWIKYLVSASVPRIEKLWMIRRSVQGYSFLASIYVWLLYYHILFIRNKEIVRKLL